MRACVCKTHLVTLISIVRFCQQLNLPAKPKKEFQVWTICLISLHLTKQNYRPNQSFCVLIQWVAVVVAPFNAVRTWQLSVSIVLIVGITNSWTVH